MDRIWRFLSSDLLLLIGLRYFDLQGVDHRRWLFAKDFVRAAVIVELHPFPDSSAGLRPGLPSLQVDALVFQRAPQTLDEDVVQVASGPINLVDAVMVAWVKPVICGCVM